MESIAYYLQMTLYGGQTEVGEQVDRLQQMVDNANWVITDMLHLLQMAPANPVSVDLVELQEEVLAEPWVSDGLAIDQCSAVGLPAVRVDLEQCRHLLRAVFQFMRRSLDDPQDVHISSRYGDDVVEIEFRAHAPHIHTESLFQPLECNQLLTCRNIAEKNAGHFTAEKGKDGWLCLCLTLPVVAAV